MTTSTGVVFYGLGDFVGTTALVDGQPADAYAAAGLTEDATIADLLRMKKGSSMPSAGPSALALLDIADDGVRQGDCVV
jgi:hypothetical protein